MRRKVIVLALAAAMTVTTGGTAYAAEKSGDVTQNSETAETGSDEKSGRITGCEAGEHQWAEWNITIPADCVTNGQKTRKCELCGTTETVSTDKTDEHDLKEISRQEATEDKPGFILYACKRNGCDYQEKVELSVKEAEDSGDSENEKNSEKTNSEKDKTAASETEDNDSENKDMEAEKESETNENTEKNEEQKLPAEDTDEESASFAYATSSEVTAEYDPTTAVSTRKIIRDSSNPASAEEVEGMTVPEGIVKVQRDSDGNITDLAVSDALEEITNGFSFSSETKTLHSISIINEKDSSKNWITLTAKKKASEFGIRIKKTTDGLAVTLTENKKSVRIVKADSDETKITLITSTGGTCVISKHIQEFVLSRKDGDLRDISEILFCDMDSRKPSVELATGKELRSEKDKKIKAEEEKLYWIQQYDDETQNPIVITIYE